ncbi:MAG: GNAT family N-acetyltransferase [Flavobacteriales bacterium]|nr:GNAT family N-acetyltransferase [Flavobacteriales bacterium]
MNTIAIRSATLSDIGFLTEAIIAAERSGTDRPGIASLHGLEEEDLPELIRAMFEEEVDGCELSVSSFLIAESDQGPVAAVAGWIEGEIYGLSSGLLRSNLIGYTFPATAMESLRRNGPAAAALKLDREPGTLQIEYVYVSPMERGKRLAAQLIAAHIEIVKTGESTVHKVQIQVFNNNDRALSAYLKMGFNTVREVRSQDTRTMELLPFNEKSLLEMTL